MKKSLVVMAILVTSLALAGTASAYHDWSCFDMPVCKQICRSEVLCMGQAKGCIPLGCGPCGPCAPAVTYSGKWLCVAKCPPAKVEKKAPAPPFITLPKVTREVCAAPRVAQNCGRLFIVESAPKAPKVAAKGKGKPAPGKPAPGKLAPGKAAPGKPAPK